MTPSSKELKRLLIVALFTFFLFALLILQFYKIQILECDKWVHIAKKQHQQLIKEKAKRGLFYSNTSVKEGHKEEAQAFLCDIPTFHLYADPLSIPTEKRDGVSRLLNQVLQLKGEEFLKLRAQLDKISRSRRLTLFLDQEQQKAIQKLWLPFAKKEKIASNALFFIQDFKRSYPFGKLLGPLLHTVREEKDPKTGEVVPTGGLEMLFNNYLTGKDGKRLILRSPRHPLDAGELISSPENGADVYLSINHYLQAIAEEEIEKAVVQAEAKGGWAVMMEPNSGEILALAQYPFFDPSDYRKFFNDPKLQEQTKIKAVTDPYEPGSIMKPITIAVTMQANAELKQSGKKEIFSPSEKLETRNTHFPGRSKPLKDLYSHNYMNLPLAMQKSSNIYMARMVQRVVEAKGAEWYRHALQTIFGFGIKTGVEIPSESGGLLPTPGKKHPSGALEWSAPTPYSLAIGHNILATSMQMLRAYAIIANGGFDVQPTVVRSIIKTKSDGSRETLFTHQPQEPKRLLDPQISRELIRVMKYVTKPGGTAWRADVPGYTEAGKTGTSEKIIGGTYSKKDHISTFIGFTPAENPRFVLIVVIDEPATKYIPGVGKNHMGGFCAAPAFARIAERSLHYLGVEPNDPHGYPKGDPRHNPKQADWFEETQELLKLHKAWNG